MCVIRGMDRWREARMQHRDFNSRWLLKWDRIKRGLSGCFYFNVEIRSVNSTDAHLDEQCDGRMILFLLSILSLMAKQT